MDNNKMTLGEWQDNDFLTFTNNVISRTTDATSSTDAIAILVSLGELFPKLAEALKSMSPITKKQEIVFELLMSIKKYAEIAESGGHDPLQLLHNLRTSAIAARDQFVSSPSLR